MGLFDKLTREMERRSGLHNAFLKTMDNDPSNDWLAHAEIARLASTMSDDEIFEAYKGAHAAADKANNGKNAILSGEKPYQNLNGAGSQHALRGGLMANDYASYYPNVPPYLWTLFGA